MTDELISSPELLGPAHAVAGFDCGIAVLSEFLSERALADQRSDKSRTYVITTSGRVVGFFTLVAASVEAEDASERARKGQGSQPVPAILLARLAIDKEHQGKALGEALLIDALARSAEAAKAIGARVVLVHAKDPRAREFYARYGFEVSPTDPLHLMILMKDVRKSLQP